MKFSEISKEKWEELSPYLDTCLLPVTGMTESIEPYEATKWLEQLRDIMDLIEIPFKGRVVTYPAWHYVDKPEQISGQVERWCSSMKQSGFRYIIVVTANGDFTFESPSIDLWFKPDEDGVLPLQAVVSERIRTLWSGQAT
ncbi:hypothetical protein BK133_13705 [Paenibacillus sp. FSL H8-0548]|uniref:DUF2487 family protein n=1 Tax=Paenibacillus sp. FSL H8-0548 TaxID=1920422 RepID=UPI00096ECC95|nr:DUF2487 family protein [Paenibacillus sp. FSL H8-0548]OMF33838.1 hypothetical protein BK133_13705 [Paenibacillus sp. FSL H8-0548]